MLLAGLALVLLWWYAQRADLIKEDTEPETIIFIQRKNWAIPIIAIIAIFTAFISPNLSNLVYILLFAVIPILNRLKPEKYSKLD